MLKMYEGSRYKLCHDTDTDTVLEFDMFFKQLSKWKLDTMTLGSVGRYCKEEAGIDVYVEEGRTLHLPVTKQQQRMMLTYLIKKGVMVYNDE